MNTKKRNIGARLGAMLLSLCLMMGLLPTTAFAADQPTKRNEYNVYSANVINGSAAAGCMPLPLRMWTGRISTMSILAASPARGFDGSNPGGTE